MGGGAMEGACCVGRVRLAVESPAAAMILGQPPVGKLYQHLLATQQAPVRAC